MSNQNQDLAAEIARLREENARLLAAKAAKAPKPSAKIAKSGGISVYGLNRFPVTLHAEQWEKVFAMAEEIRALINLPEAEKTRLMAIAQAKADAYEAAKG